MDPKRFDHLARRIGAGESRRGFLKAVTGGTLGAVAAVIGFGGTSTAAQLRPNGAVCREHANCQTGACYPKNRVGRRVCGPNLCVNNQVICEPLDDCHVVGVCEPTTGICTSPEEADGTACQRFSGECSNGVCELYPTLSCAAGSQCLSQCPDSGDIYCTCGTTIEGDPVCHHGDNGCAGHSCAISGDCGDLGPTSTCISGFCSAPGTYCTSSGDCGDGAACVNLNGGCGGCDLFTGGQGICQSRCTS